MNTIIKNTLFICLFIQINISIKGQPTPYPINFKDTNYISKYNIKNKSKIRFKIININRFIYKVSSEISAEDFNIQAPSIFSQLTIPSFLNVKAPSLDRTVAGDDPNRTGINSSMEDIDANIAVIWRNALLINEAISLNNKLSFQLKRCDLDSKKIIDDAITDLSQLVNSKSNTIIDLIKELEFNLNAVVEQTQEINRILKIQHNNWSNSNSNKFRETTSKLAIEKEAYSYQVGVLKEKKQTAKKSEIDKINNEIYSLEFRIRNLQTSIQHLTEDNSISIKRMNDEIAKTNEIITSIINFKLEGNLYTILENISKFNITNFTYSTDLIEISKDQTKILITAAAENPIPCEMPLERRFDITVKNVSGIKIDFSTGIFGNFGSERFHGISYYYENVDDEVSQIKAIDVGKRVGLSIGALMHIYSRSPNKIKPALTLGISASANLEALNYHIGPTLMIGAKERFCLSAGLTLRQVKILDYRYKTDINYEKKILPESIPMDTKFPIGGFFLGLTYNLSRISK